MKIDKMVFKNIAWLVFDKFFALVSSFLIIFVIANFYGAEDFGLFQYATSIVLMLDTLLQIVDGRVVKKKYNDANQEIIVYNVTVLKGILSCLAFGIGIILLFVSNRRIGFTYILLLLLMDSIIKSLRFGMENRYEFHLKSKNVVIATDVGLLICCILQLYFASKKLPIQFIALAQVVSTMICFSILLYKYNSDYKIKIIAKIDIKLILSVIKESLPLAIGSAACVIYTKCDSIMLGLLLTEKDVGIYSIAAKLISASQVMIVPIQTTIYVKMIAWYSQKKDYEKKYLQVTTLSTWVSIIGVIVSIIFLPWLFTLFNDEYQPAIRIYKILSLSTIISYNAILRSSHFTLINKGKILMFTQVFTVLINIFLNYYLINWFGMYGAALSTVIAQFVSLFMSNLFFKEARFVLKNQIKALNPFELFKWRLSVSTE